MGVSGFDSNMEVVKIVLITQVNGENDYTMKMAA